MEELAIAKCTSPITWESASASSSHLATPNERSTSSKSMISNARSSGMRSVMPRNASSSPPRGWLESEAGSLRCRGSLFARSRGAHRVVIEHRLPDLRDRVLGVVDRLLQRHLVQVHVGAVAERRDDDVLDRKSTRLNSQSPCNIVC